jgi:hypothetical protein
MRPDGSRSEGTPSLSERAERWGKTFWFLLRRLSKGTRRKGETASRNTQSYGYPHQTTHNMVGPKAAKHTKKRATEVAQNALRAHQTQKDLLLALIRIFPDKKSKPCKKQNHESYGQNPGKHHVIEKHDCGLLAPALLRWN